MTRRYEATINVEIRDPAAMKVATTTTLEVTFDQGDDPMEMLTRRALEAGVEACDTAKRYGS